MEILNDNPAPDKVPDKECIRICTFARGKSVLVAGRHLERQLEILGSNDQHGPR